LIPDSHQELAQSAFRPATEPVQIRSFSTRRSEWLWEYAQDKDFSFIFIPLGSIGDAAMKEYRLIEAVGRPFDTALTAARMIYSAFR